MARIRSIKPEFWIDEKLVELSPFARLLFIGLWNFADDQGYIDYKPRRIKMQVFPADDLDIDELLDELLASGRLVAYDSPVGPVLHIVNWHHQKVDKPARPRFDADDLRELPKPPRPPSTPPEPIGEPSTALARTRESSGASVATEGKGSGSGGDLDPEGIYAPSARALALVASPPEPPATAQTLVAEWIDHCAEKPPQRVIGQVARQLRELLAEGIDAGHVRRGLAAWHTKGLNPSTLPSVVNEVMNAGTRARASPRRDDIDWTAAMQRAQAREAANP